MFQVASGKRAITWTAVVAYGLVVSGLPLPSGGFPPESGAAGKRLAGKDRSTPFPCMDKPCGCATAGQCFTNCCCHSPAETLAWARAHDVEPAVIAALQRRVAAAPTPAESSCCSVKTSCCEAEATPPVENPPPDVPDEPSPGRSLSLRAMLACGGVVAEWFSCGVSLPPPAAAIVTGLECIESLPFVDESASPVRAAPDAPPPRVA